MIMKKQLLLLAMILLPMMASAYDIAVQNADGISIYYNYINNGTELEVTYQVAKFTVDNNEDYVGTVVIPEEVVYMNRTRKVTSIGTNAFRRCKKTTSVIIPNCVTNIGEYAFYGCESVNNVTIPSSVTNVGRDAFSYCSGMTSVTVEDCVATFGMAMFEGCSNLVKVIVKDVASWCGIKFGGKEANPLFYAHHLYSDEDTEITDLVIPNGVMDIGDYAFYSCTGLTSLTISNSVTSIGWSSFQNCSRLNSVSLGNCVTDIGGQSFRGCIGIS